MPDKPHVVLYTRPNCHLCERVKAAIVSANCEGEYTFEEINIDDDQALALLYGTEIPVVAIDGVEVFKHRLTAHEFKDQIRRAKLGSQRMP